MKVRIVKMNRGWEWIAWACPTCIAVKRRDGYVVELGKAIEQRCDFCGEGAE